MRAFPSRIRLFGTLPRGVLFQRSLSLNSSFLDGSLRLRDEYLAVAIIHLFLLTSTRTCFLTSHLGVANNW